jgi:hypothetical protein
MAVFSVISGKILENQIFKISIKKKGVVEVCNQKNNNKKNNNNQKKRT